MRRVIWQAVLEEGLFSDESGRASLDITSHEGSYQRWQRLFNLRLIVSLICLTIG